MKKKTLSIAAALAASISVAGALFAWPSAHAQLFPYTSTSTTPSSSVVATTTSPSTTSSGTTSSISSTTVSGMSSTSASTTGPGATITGGVSAGGGMYLQMNHLLITNIAQTSQPSTLTAAGSDTATCTQFSTDVATAGTVTPCPITTATPYTVIVNSATRLLFSDRVPASLSDITAGDAVNVYGFYDHGTIDAMIVRDISRSSGGAAGASAQAGGATTNSILQAELDQLKILVLQLEAEVTGSSTTSTAKGNAPMIPASSTVNSSGTIY